MPLTSWPLEGDKFDEACFHIYDGIGKTVWGVARVRRDKNPDVLVLEVRRKDQARFSPVLMMTAIQADLIFRSFGLKGGSDGGTTQTPSTPVDEEH